MGLIQVTTAGIPIVNPLSGATPSIPMSFGNFVMYVSVVSIIFYYLPQSLGQGNIFTGVCLYTGGRCMCVADTPLGRHPHWADIP